MGGLKMDFDILKIADMTLYGNKIKVGNLDFDGEIIFQTAYTDQCFSIGTECWLNGDQVKVFATEAEFAGSSADTLDLVGYRYYLNFYIHNSDWLEDGF